MARGSIPTPPARQRTRTRGQGASGSIEYEDVFLSLGQPALRLEAREKVDAFLGFYEYLADEAKRSNRQNGDADLPWHTETDATCGAAIENDLDFPTALQAVVLHERFLQRR